MGAVSDIDYNRCAGYVQQQEEFQNIDLHEKYIYKHMSRKVTLDVSYKRHKIDMNEI
jgi:hypothetical protein